MSLVMHDYRCESCGTITESLQPRPAPEAVACSHCGDPAERIVSAVRQMTQWAWATTGPSEKPPNPWDSTRHVIDGGPAPKRPRRRIALD